MSLLQRARRRRANTSIRRTSLVRHLVVFGPGNFPLCSRLQLSRRGLPCRHYFAVLLVNLIGRTYGETEAAFEHTVSSFNGTSVHAQPFGGETTSQTCHGASPRF